MYGARALAMPVKYGQSIKITENSKYKKLVWIAYEFGKEWFRAVYSIKSLELEDTSDNFIGIRLQKILVEGKLLNPQFIDENSGYLVETNLNFNRQWGLGTSSTLIANIAKWANIDPFLLHWKVSSGSGYDIACAGSDSAIVYKVFKQDPIIEYVSFKPNYHKHLFFVYLEIKQNTANSIDRNFKNNSQFSMEVERMSQLTDRFIKTNSIKDAIPIVYEHEMLISSIINIPTIKNKLFSDFSGAVKSLGAWGGDFIMVLTTMSRPLVEQYFRKKGYPVIIPFDEMIL